MNDEERQAMEVRQEAIRSRERQRKVDEGWIEDEVTGILVDPNYPQAFDEAAEFMDGFGDLADEMIDYAAGHDDLDKVLGTFGKLVSKLERDGTSDEASSLISFSFAAASKGWRNQAERYRELG